MARALALAHATLPAAGIDWLRPVLVIGCGLALVFARQPLPL